MTSPRRQSSCLRAGLWVLHIGLPLLGLWVLLATGQTTAALIGRVAKLEPHGEVEVKGRSEPVVAYRLVGLDEPGA